MKRLAKGKVGAETVRTYLEELFEEDVHAKRVLSLGNAVIGAIEAAALGVHVIGQGLADALGLDPKHAMKQVDRLLSNSAYDMDALQREWARFVLAERDEAVVVIDWTEFAKDDQLTLALHVVTTHGRSTPLLWKTVRKSMLARKRAAHEDELLHRLREIIPLGMKLTILADRGFADQDLYPGLEDFGFDYVVRFRGDTLVTSGGETRPAVEWMGPNGRTRRLDDVELTRHKTRVPSIVCTQAKGMKEPWCLVSSLRETIAADIVKLYSRRFTIEESFRDAKDPRFGLGLAATRISSPERRDKLLLIGALAQGLLTLLGAAGEATGLDSRLKANTSKKRVYSLFRQGIMWYRLTRNMPEERLRILMTEFGKQVLAHAVFTQTFGVI